VKNVRDIFRRNSAFAPRTVVLLCLLALANVAGAASPVVLVLGDSLSAAYGLSEKSGWVHLLRERLANHNPRYEVVNISISGDTTRGGLTRVGAALKQYKPRVVIIELGGNDGLRGMPLHATQGNLDDIVTAVKQVRAKPLVVGVEIPSNYGPAYTKQFAQVFQNVAKKHNVPVVPSIMESFSEKPELFQPDGIHPVAAAQPFMIDTVWKGLAPLL
jgi:acyl-CoA thioesterase-1